MPITIHLPLSHDSVREFHERMERLTHYDADVGGRTIDVVHGDDVGVDGLEDEPVLQAQLYRVACTFVEEKCR